MPNWKIMFSALAFMLLIYSEVTNAGPFDTCAINNCDPDESFSPNSFGELFENIFTGIMWFVLMGIGVALFEGKKGQNLVFGILFFFGILPAGIIVHVIFKALGFV